MPTAAEEIAAAAAKRAVKKAVREEALKDPGFKANPLPVPANPAPGAPMGTSSNRGGRKTRRRLMSRKYCKKTPCRRMGFTQKASCRPYKNCYK